SRNELIDMLHGSRRRLDMALDAGGIIGTWALDISAPRANIDNTLVDLLGLQREKAQRGLDDIFSASVHSADRARVLDALDDAIISGSDYQCRFRIVTRQGAIHWLIASGRSVGGREGSEKRLVGVVIDVTEHAETEAALHQSNLRFHIVTESIPQIVWSTDECGRHDYFNNRWTEFTGIKVEATGPDTWKTLVHPDDWPIVDLAWRESLASGNTYDIDFRFRHHDGAYRWLKFLAKPIRDTDGNITRWYGTGMDIDDAKHLELERELVAHELDHRIKNFFTLVNALVSLSVWEQPALRPLTEPLSARLSALHQAHCLISGTPDSRAGTLQALLRQLLRPYEGEPEIGKTSISGMDMAIDAGAFKSMALVMHELITNSAKYGALSQKEGSLHVALHADADRLTITWEELFSGKSDVEKTSGFGSKLIKNIVEMQLRGSIMHNFRQDGLNIIINLPRSEIFAKEYIHPEYSAPEIDDK
ncbi:PAS domain-containing protein, partial [Paraburkholderia aspalathi]|nr:PAS domain-containing protein [Paraburkholderia aspalathi]